MKMYKCPEGDYEQDMPGMCPNHPGLELEMVEGMEGEEEKEMEGKGMEEKEAGEKEEESEMDDEE